MQLSPAKSQSSSGAGPTALQQICITHCLQDEGVYRRAGFTVRASSTLEPLLVRFALEYPSYEVPAGVTGDQLTVAAAPRRLALVRIPGGQSALIHSVYLPEDERGRANNFFSHFLFRPALGARQALATWASPHWMTRCDREAGTELPALDRLPESEAVCDDAVTAFLQPAVSAAEGDLATLTCPQRLADEPKKRRELMGLALRGCLLALQAAPAAARARFYILAEPGLTALLLYAAARLMPDALAANLTFSTYENAHRDLRTYKHARVVGTYTADPARGLDSEFFTTRGYALDTFGHKFSPELQSGVEPAIDEWIDLAARGDWKMIDKVQRLLGKTSTSVLPFKEGVQAAKISQRMASGQASADDFVTLKRSSWGAAILSEHEAKIWPLVRDSSLNDERVRADFANVLRERLPELQRQAGKALSEEPPGDWQPSWRLLCAILKDDPARLRDTVQRILPEPPYPPGLRLDLLVELHRCKLSPLDQRAPWHTVLKQCSSEDLTQFTRFEVPREWFVWALIYAMARPEPRAQAVRLLHAGDDDLARSFWGQFRMLKDEGPRRTILTLLFPAGAPEGARFLDRLLALRMPVRAETLEWLLDTFAAFSREGAEFWGRDNHLGLLLDLLRGLGEEAGPMWDRLCALITRDVLPPGDAYQNTVLMELAAARDRPGPALPRKTAQVVADWTLLREHFEKATDVPESSRRAVIDACNRLHFDSIDVLCRYFERFILPQGTNKAVLDDFVGFFHSFFLAGMDHQEYSSRLIAWLQIVASCPDETQRAAYQRYYLENHVPLEFRARLAEETHETGRLLPAVFQAFQQGKPQAPAEAPKPIEAPAPATAIDELFQLSGVRLAKEPSSLLASVGRRLFWLLCTVAAGLLAAWLTGFYKVQLQRVAAMILFVPVVLAVAESMALQSVALAVRAFSEPSLTRRVRARRLFKEVLAGIVLGLTCGLIVAVVAKVWTNSQPLALSLGVALAGGMAGAAAVGCLLPFLLRCNNRLAAGPVARALAALLALFLYFGLSCLLLR